MKTLAIFVLFLLASGCAGVTEVRYALKPEANTCQVVETRATAFSTLVSGVCWDRDGRVIGMTGAGGKPGVSVPMEILGAAATVAAPAIGAAILGQYILKSAEAVSAVKVTVPEIPIKGQVAVPAQLVPVLQEHGF